MNVRITALQVCKNLFAGFPDGELQIENSKCLSRNDYLIAQDLTLLNNQ